MLSISSFIFSVVAFFRAIFSSFLPLKYLLPKKNIEDKRAITNTEATNLIIFSYKLLFFFTLTRSDVSKNVVVTSLLSLLSEEASNVLINIELFSSFLSTHLSYILLFIRSDIPRLSYALLFLSRLIRHLSFLFNIFICYFQLLPCPLKSLSNCS